MGSETAVPARPLEGMVVWMVGASGAIGRAIATTLGSCGASVVASGRKAAALAGVVAEIRRTGGSASARVIDICDGPGVIHAAQEIIAAHGRIDGLVNCTSLSIFGDFLELTDAQWLQVLDTKLLGYARTMRAVLPHMAGRGAGSIVNISGRGGRQPTPAHLPGGAANAGVNLLSKGLADAYVAYGVRINVVAPGPIASPRFDKVNETNLKITGGVVPHAALNRLGAPEDVANAVAWLLSAQSRHTTGAVIPVDGGGIATV